MSLLKIDGVEVGPLLDMEAKGKEIAGTLLAMAAENPFHYEGVVPYYRRQQPDGLVKVWLRSPRAKFELVISAELAAEMKPSIPITLNFG